MLIKVFDEAKTSLFPTRLDSIPSYGNGIGKVVQRLDPDDRSGFMQISRFEIWLGSGG